MITYIRIWLSLNDLTWVTNSANQAAQLSISKATFLCKSHVLRNLGINCED